jgi:hypothetical protein
MQLYIELGSDQFTLEFNVLDNPVADLWVERMMGRDKYPLDNPNRFYGFDSQAQEESRALAMIQSSIDTINSYSNIITRTISSVYDQDTLNYLHSIFEQYHGLLDQQSSNFWSKAPDQVKQALADLNINVHRCESVAQGNQPRFVCTWYGLPKTHTLTAELMGKYGTLVPEFGTVCLNYCEIGKTLEDLATDNDQYISDEAFRPFSFYSADFVVRFFETKVGNTLTNMLQYYRKNKEFFNRRGFAEFDDPRLLPLHFPVATLIESMPQDKLLIEISKRQCVTKVYFGNL